MVITSKEINVSQKQYLPGLPVINRINQAAMKKHAAIKHFQLTQMHD